MGNCCVRRVYELCEVVPSCIATLQVQTTYLDKNLTATFADRHGNEYNFYDLVTDSNGLLTIDLSLNEELLLVPYAQYFLLSLSEDTTCQNSLPFIVDGLEYSHLQFVVKNKFPEVDNYLIKLNCEENSGYYL
jgi:hypothetical protein